MSSEIVLEAIPNQEFTIRLEDLRYRVRINAIAETCAVATVERDGVVIVSSTRIVPGQLIIPYPYLEGNGGNFILSTEDDELPDYEQFGTTQRLFYLTAAELGAARESI